MAYTDEVIEQMARVVHEANKVLCMTIGDWSQPSWDETPDNIKASAIDGVRAHIANPNMTPAESHANWMDFKIKDGWVYGEEKDLEKKTHPCLLPYEELPQEQRKKDTLFGHIVSKIMELT